MGASESKGAVRSAAEKKAWEALATVEEPDLKKDLVSLGMIESLEIKGHEVHFVIVLTTPACPLRELIRTRCEKALKAALGAETDIHIRFEAQVSEAPKKENALPGVKNLIGIASGKGGVGKSTVAVNLAVLLAEQGARTGLVDADIFGPSLPTLMGCRGERPHIFKDGERNRLSPIEQHGLKLMSIGFLIEEQQAVMWRGPMASTALKQLLGDTDWGALDYLLVDLPPGTSDIPITLAQSFPLTGMVMVSTPQAVAIADLRKGIAMCRQPQLNIPILGLIENMAYYEVGTTNKERYHPFGQGAAERLAEEASIFFLGTLPLHASISEGNDTGYPAVLRQGAAREDFLQLSQRLAQQIALHNASAKATSDVVHA